MNCATKAGSFQKRGRQIENPARVASMRASALCNIKLAMKRVSRPSYRIASQIYFKTLFAMPPSIHQAIYWPSVFSPDYKETIALTYNSIGNKN
jgi:hypothetical protein